jgi:hypothetical protein
MAAPAASFSTPPKSTTRTHNAALPCRSRDSRLFSLCLVREHRLYIPTSAQGGALLEAFLKWGRCGARGRGSQPRAREAREPTGGHYDPSARSSLDWDWR